MHFFASLSVKKLALDINPPLSAVPSDILRISISAGVNPAHSLDENRELRPWPLAMSGIPKRPRPFADRLVVDAAVRCASNDGREWIRVFVERQTSELERSSQKPFGPSPSFMAYDHGEHGS